jgi:hypothetical protein
MKGSGLMESQAGTASASQLHALLGKFFAAKNALAVDGTMAYISPDMITYTDATLGMALDSYAAVKAGRTGMRTGRGLQNGRRRAPAS